MKLYAQAHYQLYLLFFPLLALYVNDVQNPEGSTFKISIKTIFFLFICKRLKKLEYLTRWRFVTKIIKKSKKEEEEDKICNSHIFVFGGEKKCLFSRRVEEWEMRTWHHSEVGQECWSPVSFWGWKKRCKIAASHVKTGQKQDGGHGIHTFLQAWSKD